MPELEFSVYCDVCGEGLCNKTSVHGNKVYIETCDKCLENRYQEGYDDGYQTGKEESNT